MPPEANIPSVMRQRQNPVAVKGVHSSKESLAGSMWATAFSVPRLRGVSCRVRTDADRSGKPLA